jgi:hypothetical protein
MQRSSLSSSPTSSTPSGISVPPRQASATSSSSPFAAAGDSPKTATSAKPTSAGSPIVYAYEGVGGVLSAAGGTASSAPAVGLDHELDLVQIAHRLEALGQMIVGMILHVARP